MANSIYVQRLGKQDAENTWISPLVEDMQITVGSEFTSFADMAPMLSSLVDLGNMATTGFSGILSGTGKELRNTLDQAKWQRTNPIEITTSLSFFTKTNSKEDVVKKVANLISLSVLSVVGEGTSKKIIVPGIALNVLSQIKDKEQGNETDFLEASKLVSVLIPGIIYMSAAYVKTVQPTYSKHTTILGYPLWAKVDVTFAGVGPAMDTDFINGMNYSFNTITNTAVLKPI